MSNEGEQQPSANKKEKPPGRHWKATEPFFDLKASHWVEIFLTVALLCVGISQLYVYCRQAGIMEKQTAILNAANDLNAATQRPYIFSKGLQPDARIGADGKAFAWTMNLLLTNSGNTPAKDVYSIILSRFSNEKIAETLAKKTKAYVFDSSSFIDRDKRLGAPTDPADYLHDTSALAPWDNWPFVKKGSFPIGPRESITIFNADDIYGYELNRSSPIWSEDFVSGAIEYSATFPELKHHIVKFCYNTTGFTSVGGNITPSPGLCSHWNCADDECDRDKQEYEAEMAKTPLVPGIEVWRRSLPARPSQPPMPPSPSPKP